jgi:hypothetical protein
VKIVNESVENGSRTDKNMLLLRSLHHHRRHHHRHQHNQHRILHTQLMSHIVEHRNAWETIDGDGWKEKSKHHLECMTRTGNERVVSCEGRMSTLGIQGNEMKRKRCRRNDGQVMMMMNRNRLWSTVNE